MHGYVVKSVKKRRGEIQGIQLNTVALNELFRKCGKENEQEDWFHKTVGVAVQGYNLLFNQDRPEGKDEISENKNELDVKEDVPNINVGAMNRQLIELKKNKAELRKQLLSKTRKLQKSEETIVDLKDQIANFWDTLARPDRERAGESKNKRDCEREIQKEHEKVIACERELKQKEEDHEVELSKLHRKIISLQKAFDLKDERRSRKSIELGLVINLAPESMQSTKSIEFGLLNTQAPENTFLSPFKCWVDLSQKGRSLENVNIDISSMAQNRENQMEQETQVGKIKRTFSISNFYDEEANVVGNDSDISNAGSVDNSADSDLKSFINDSIDAASPRRNFKEYSDISPKVKIGGQIYKK